MLMVEQLYRTQFRSVSQSQPNVRDGVAGEGCVLASVHLDGIETGVSGLAMAEPSAPLRVPCVTNPARSECPPSLASAVES